MLPKLATPIFSTTLPVSRETVRFRPWLVGDKKALLVAMASNDPKMMRETVFDVVQKCLIDQDLMITALPAIDVSWLVLQIRMRSDSDTVEFGLVINDCTSKGSCTQKIKVDLNDVQVIMPEAIDPKIMLTEDVGVKMRVITMDIAQQYFTMNDKSTKSSPEKIVDSYFDMVAMCIECVFDASNVYPIDSIPRQELIEFLGTMNDEQFRRLQSYVENMPRLEKTIQTTCKDCGRVINYTARGLDDFFV